MAFVSNSLDFPNLTTKSTPVSADILLLADSAASNAVKQCTVGSLPYASSPGGLNKIAAATASNSATVSFANNLTSTYDNYLIVYEVVVPATNVTNFLMVVGTGSGPSYQTSSYEIGALSTSVELNTGLGNSSNTGASGAGLIYITGVNTATYKMIFATGYGTGSSITATVTTTVYGSWQGGTAALTSVQFSMAVGNISTGNFKLYGFIN